MKVDENRLEILYEEIAEYQDEEKLIISTKILIQY